MCIRPVVFYSLLKLSSFYFIVFILLYFILDRFIYLNLLVSNSAMSKLLLIPSQVFFNLKHYIFQLQKFDLGLFKIFQVCILPAWSFLYILGYMEYICNNFFDVLVWQFYHLCQFCECVYLLIFVFILVYIIQLLCMPDNFLFNSEHCDFYLVRCLIFL